MKAIVLMLVCASSVAEAHSEEKAENGHSLFVPDRAGPRVGFSMDGDSSEFHQAEVAVAYLLPWSWQAGSHFVIETGLEASAGWLGDGTEDAMVFSAGPQAAIRYREIPVALRFGSNPTYISRFSFNHRDFGTEVQFISHVGFSWDVTRHIQVSYRLQHMSNAGFASPNPGLNMHMCGISWVF